MVGAGGNRQGLLRSVRDTTRRSAVSIEHPQPWPRAVMILRDVKDVAIVDRCRETHIRVVISEAFRLSAAGSNPPQIHLPSALNAACKVDPSTIGRPCLMMVVPFRNR